MTPHLPVLAALACLTATSAAQLSGSYTINNAIPTVGTNFNSFVDAATALTTSGVSASVTFTVATGTGPYGGFAILTAVTGASATKTITFAAGAGQTPVVSGPAGSNLQTIKLGTAATANSGPSYITLRGLTVQGAATGAAILCAGCTYMTVDRCIALNSGTGIYFTQTQYSVIQDCEVNACGYTAGAPGGTAAYTGGITLYERSDSCVVQRNKVHDCLGDGIFAGGGGSTTAQVRDDVISNNFVWNCPGFSTYPGGISLRRVTGSTVSNNSVIMPAGSTLPGLSIGAATSGTGALPGWGPAAEVSNNIVQHLGSGPCIFFDVATASVPVVFDQNHYDAAGAGPVGKVGTTVYATIAAWQAVTTPNLAGKELSSIAAPAGFVSGTDLHITVLSAAFDSGSSVALVPLDIDKAIRPLGAKADRGAHEILAAGHAIAFGDACSGAAGSVLLTTSSASGFYQTGTNLTFTSTNHGASAPGAMVIGASRTTYLGLPLPYLLDPLLQTNNCWINASLEVTLNGTTGAASPATLSFTLPVSPILAGARFYVQHACLEAVPGGLSTSNGVVVQIQ